MTTHYHPAHFKTLDLFSGIGGFSLGLENTGGFETVAFCEFDKHARKVLNKHWPDKLIHEDVRTLDGTKYKGSIDVVCGGFPCQDLSVAGKKKGITAGERSNLYTEMLRIISECLPRYAIFENVTGLLTGESGRWFAKFLYDLAQVGYDAEWHCISASELGAPHHRDRVWIIAYPKREGSQRCVFEGFNLQRKSKQAHAKLGNRIIPVGIDWQTDCLSLLLGDGIPTRLARRAVKQYGNTLLPAIPELIGRAILKYEGLL